MSDPPRRQVSWRAPRSAPAKSAARRGWRRPLSGAGLVAAALLAYLGWSRWQAPSPRREPRPVARQLAVDLAPARPSAAGATRGRDKVSDVADLLGDEPGGGSSAERSPTPRAPPHERDETMDAAPPAEPIVTASPSAPARPALPQLGERASAEVEPPSEGRTSGEPAETEAAEQGGDRPPLERHVELITLSRWQHPGLCATNDQAARARELMLRRFHVLRWEPGARLFLDPRLAAGTSTPLIEQLEHAEGEVQRELALNAPRPDVFAYHDKKLLLAASCANPDVVAYYDGALHVVPSHDDVAQSVIHEYAHHALASAGVVGPAWAHEGIAMLVARETWWQEVEWLDRVAERPFALEDMESAVPYTLGSEQATAFYVQAAAMVACAIRDEPGGLAALVKELAAGSRGGDLTYQLPPLADPRYLRTCTRELSN